MRHPMQYDPMRQLILETEIRVEALVRSTSTTVEFLKGVEAYVERVNKRDSDNFGIVKYALKCVDYAKVGKNNYEFRYRNNEGDTIEIVKTFKLSERKAKAHSKRSIVVALDVWCSKTEPARLIFYYNKEAENGLQKTK